MNQIGSADFNYFHYLIALEMDILINGVQGRKWDWIPMIIDVHDFGGL